MHGSGAIAGIGESSEVARFREHVGVVEAARDPRTGEILRVAQGRVVG